MGEVVGFMNCSFCGVGQEECEYLIKTSQSKHAAICDKCLIHAWVILQNTVAGVYEDEMREKGYHCD
jgi:hypothetical protein